jgi:hypothetical protein
MTDVSPPMQPSEVWVVRTAFNFLHGWYYAGVEAEDEARRLVEEQRPGERIIGAKRVGNVDRVENGGFRPVPIGEYWGSLTSSVEILAAEARWLDLQNTPRNDASSRA